MNRSKLIEQSANQQYEPPLSLANHSNDKSASNVDQTKDTQISKKRGSSIIANHSFVVEAVSK